MYRKLMCLGLVAALCLTAAAGASTVKINFQLRGAAIPPGYLPDYGQVYGPQVNGFSYGWSRNIEADARERNSANAPDQRYDTLIHLQKGTAAVWEIEVPSGTFTLHIGAGDASNTDQTNTFDVEGTLVVDSTPATGNFDEYDVTVEVKDGRLTIKPGAGASNSKIMWVDITGQGFDQLLGKAKNPSPANGEEGLTMPLFTWTPGATAVLHNMYLGTSPELTEADRVGQSLFTALHYYTNPLAPGAKYYWRVDEVEADGKTVYTGDVWTFSTASITAFRPVPADTIKWVDPNIELSWKPGKNAITHDFYLDTDKAAVEAGTSSVSRKGLYLSTWKPPAAFLPGTVYYWRVDEIASDGTKTVGAVWSFTTLPVIPISDPTLLGWWKMDEGAGATVVDWSGHGRHLTFAAPAPAWSTGHFGGALEFAGTGDGAVFADGTFLNGLDALTITAWIKSDVMNTDKGFIIFADPTGSDNQDMRYDAAGSTGGGTNVQKMGIGVTADGTTTTILQLESSNGSQSTDWQHVTMTWKSGQALQFYINGKPDAPTANSTGMTGTLAGFSKVIIGKGGKDSASASWDGLIDEIRVYGKMLAEDEIQLVMRGDPLLAWDPNPANGSTTDEVTAVPFTWQAGDQAVRHDVYLGTEQAAVAAADASDATGIYRGRQSGTSFTPSPALEWGQKYFWRIDEVNGDGSISQGFVWSFTLANYLIVDEFETYNDDEGAGTRIYETWIDGYTDGLSGSVVGNLDPPFAEQTIVHSGRQSMPMDYNNTNSPYFSQAYREFSPVQNWTVNGLTDLSLWVRGAPAGLAPVAESGGKMAVAGEGTDIWNNSDQFTFVYKTLNGDGALVARVTSNGTGTNTWAKGGVMIRDGLGAGSTHAMMVMTGDVSAGNGCSFQYRNTADGTSTNADGAAPAIKPPYYVKIERKGDTLSGAVSADNSNWTQIGTAQYIAMSAPAYIGIAVTSHAAGAYRTFEFDNLKATGASGSWQTKEIGLTRNSPQPLYVIVEDSTGKKATVVDPNAAAVNSTAWTEWKIPLTDLKGVNLSKVKAVYVGVGDKANAAPDGTGRVYIDDIRVIKP